MTDLSSIMLAIFERNRPEFQRRVSTLEQGVAAILAGSLDESLRASAESDAHKLVGALGSFGLPRGSALAGELELRFAAGHRTGHDDGQQLAACVSALSAAVDAHPADGGAGHEVPGGDRDPRWASFDAGLGADNAVDVTSARILVVDDDEAVRQLLADILTEAGFDVRAVGSARAARLALKEGDVALMLSDVSMPGETGLDLIRFALCECPQTATLLISSLEDPAIAQVGMDFGAYGYLSKPVRRTAVLIGVTTALRRRDVEMRERAGRENLERLVALRTSALSHALGRVEAAAAQGRVIQAATIHRWAQAAEYREPGIGRHLTRMGSYCGLLADRFGLHPQSLELASVLHDVGKTAIPDSILLKRGPLTADERLAIETHAEIGYEMLRDSGSGLLDLAALIARTHHERFDGGGYPRGLSGADIPLEGRIAAVADVFDALTSHRVYRPAWPVDATIAWMTNERGTHFDPTVVDALLASLDAVEAIRSAVTG